MNRYGIPDADVVAIYGKIQDARRKYKIDDFHLLLKRMMQEGDLNSNNSVLPHKKLFGSYGHTLEDLRLMDLEDFNDSLEEMSESEQAEVFHYLGNTSKKQEIIKEKQMDSRSKGKDGKSMLKFDMPDEPEGGEETDVGEYVGRGKGTISGGPRNESAC